jgi:hypothetical protein
MNRLLATLPILAVVLLLGHATCRADVVHLRTGEAVKGKPLVGQSDESTLVMQDFLSGAMRRFAWDVVDPLDKKRIWDDWNWTNQRARQTVIGRRISVKLSDGNTEDFVGVVESENETTIQLRSGGQLLPIQKSMVDEDQPEEVSPRDVWTPEQLYARMLEQVWEEKRNHPREGESPDVLHVRDHWTLAQNAEWAEHWEKAREHYAVCAADSQFLNSGLAQSSLERVEAILRAQVALDRLREIKREVSLRSFRNARTSIAAFPEEHKDLPDVVQQQFEKVQRAFTEQRDAYFQLEAKIQFPKIVVRLIKRKVSEKDITLADATAWSKKDIPEQAFDELMNRFLKKDDVTADEARQFWERRSKSSWRSANYGGGTFIVEKPKVQQPKGGGGGGGNRQGGGAAPVFVPPKPPTRDQWWAGAAPGDRESWIFAYFIENSGLFEVGEPKWDNCANCLGRGLDSKTLSSGGTWEYLCPRCGGAQRDKRVRWR